MRRRLLNQTVGDPAAPMIAAAQARVIDDVRRFGLQQPEIVSRRDRERVTDEMRDNDPAFQAQMQRRATRETGGQSIDPQGLGSGMSSQPGRLPPAPAAPKREKLRLKRLGETD